MRRKFAKISKEDALAVAKKYSTLKDFYTKDPDVYWASIYNGWSSDYTWLKRARAKPRTWDEVYAKGKACMSSEDFREKDFQAYMYAYRNSMLCCMPWATDDEAKGALKHALSLAGRCRDMEGFRKTYRSTCRSLEESGKIGCLEAYFANRRRPAEYVFSAEPAAPGTSRMVSPEAECGLECLIDLRCGDHPVQVASDDPALCRACADVLAAAIVMSAVFVDKLNE